MRTNSSPGKDVVMWQRGLISAAIMLGGLLATAATAQSDETTNDIRCLVVGLNLAQSQNAAARGASVLMAIYYMGRLEGRDPMLELDARITDEVLKMSTLDVQSEARRCGGELKAKGEAIAEMGKKLSERGF